MDLEHFDVVIVGAGLSGVGAAYRLQTLCPTKSYVILEGRDRLGGTWDLFRYPGIRSDSDMFTLGYPFRPWKEAKAIADGPAILRYIEETAAAYGIEERIRLREKVVVARWSSEELRWTVESESGSGDARRYTCGFLWLCSGYYSYDSGHMPEFPNVGDFEGRLIHPQQWPEDLDYEGRQVVVIGSGATAVTLVPAMAEKARHVTMLQRSPTYITSLPARDAIADAARRVLPERLAHGMVRWKNVLIASLFFQLSRRRPELAKRLIGEGVRKELPGYDLEPDFTPRYEPWDQRVCFVPDADLFRAIREQRASIVTDEIETFTPTGIRLRSGRELAADVVVSATGLRLVPLGGVCFEVDNETVVPGATFVYRGFMLTGLPNLALTVGYTNASWTLRADLTARSVCRLLNHMDRRGFAAAVPVSPGGEALEADPVLGLSSGYVLRAAADLPKQGTCEPWRLGQNYPIDVVRARFADFADGLSFTPFRPAPAEAARRAPRQSGAPLVGTWPWPRSESEELQEVSDAAVAADVDLPADVPLGVGGRSFARRLDVAEPAGGPVELRAQPSRTSHGMKSDAEATGEQRSGRAGPPIGAPGSSVSVARGARLAGVPAGEVDGEGDSGDDDRHLDHLRDDRRHEGEDDPGDDGGHDNHTCDSDPVDETEPSTTTAVRFDHVAASLSYDRTANGAEMGGNKTPPSA